jgi:transposase
MEIVKRSDDTKGLVVLPRRWVVERTFSWFGETLASFVTLASSSSPSGGLPGRRS